MDTMTHLGYNCQLSFVVYVIHFLIQFIKRPCLGRRDVDVITIVCNSMLMSFSVSCYSAHAQV